MTDLLMPNIPVPCWVYEQPTGLIYRVDGTVLTRGYSGHAEGLNNPDLQYAPNIGPICEGSYRMELIVDAHGNPCDYEGKAAPVIRFTPMSGTDTHGRAGFLWHGNFRDPARRWQASHGCIVSDHESRLEAAGGLAHCDIMQVVRYRGQWLREMAPKSS